MARLIIPPSDIRVIIEKTAGFVAKNGNEFEAKIHENERHNLKFAFMNPNDPYNMYYRKRLQELIEGGPEAIMKAITDSKASEALATCHMDKPESSGTDNLLETGQNQEKPLNLENLEFLMEMPTISVVDFDVLKLTAQFAAKNGKQFILHLSQKESRNPQFDFLKPHHNLHQFYQSLVKQYTLVLKPSEGLLERVKLCAFNKTEHLKIVKHRSQIEKLDRQRIQEQNAIENAEQEAFNKIDWQDFSVAETVTFGPEDQHKDFPTPLTPKFLSQMPMIQRLEMWTGHKTNANINNSNSPVEESTAVSADEMEIDEPSVNVSAIISETPSSKSYEIVMGAAFGSGAPPIKVRTDYTPRSAISTTETQTCTICQASIPVSQIDEHIRIELLDPKWRTQRLAMLAKNKDSNLVETGTDVSRNLEALAKHRGDIFGTSISATANDTIERGPTRPIWDGHTDSIGQINRAAQILSKPQIAKEMEALQRSGDYSLDPSKGIGPRFVNSSGNVMNSNLQTETNMGPKFQSMPSYPQYSPFMMPTYNPVNPSFMPPQPGMFIPPMLPMSSQGIPFPPPQGIGLGGPFLPRPPMPSGAFSYGQGQGQGQQNINLQPPAQNDSQNLPPES